MAKKKKKTAEERKQEQEQVIEPDSEEAKAAEEQHDEVQQDAMADLLDEQPPTKSEAEAEEPAADLQTDEPPEKPADKEQKSQPDKAEVPEPDKQAKEEEQPKGEPPETKDAAVPDSKTSKKSEEEPKPAEFVSGDRFNSFEVEVVTDEGSKSVPLGNLVTTYQQFGYLQKRYQEVKPLFDLVEKAGYQPLDTMPLLELGIQAYLKQQGIVDGSQPAVAATKPAGETPPAGYQGPFSNQEQDDYYKEVDPDMHATMHRLFKLASGGSEVANLRQEIETLKQARSAPLQDDSRQKTQAIERANQIFNELIQNWAGDHTDYFTAPGIGEARLNGFKNFLIKSHQNKNIKIPRDLTPDFLAAEFARFDPRYNLEYMKKLAGKKAADGKDESGMFAEGTGVRPKAEPLDDQQKHMEDML